MSGLMRRKKRRRIELKLTTMRCGHIVHTNIRSAVTPTNAQRMQKPKIETVITRIRNIVRTGQPELTLEDIDLLLTAEMQSFHDGHRRKWIQHLERRADRIANTESSVLNTAMRRYRRLGLDPQNLESEIDRCLEVLKERADMTRVSEELKQQAAAELIEALAYWATEHSTPEDFAAVPELAEYVTNPHE